MKRIIIEEVNNGYYVQMNDQLYVYSSVEIFKMLEVIGKNLFGKKIVVKEQ